MPARDDRPMSDAELRATLHRLIDCPIAWCEGRWLDHGGEGNGPETWLHEAPATSLPLTESGTGQGYLSRFREGSGPDKWSVHIAVDHTSTDQTALIAALRDTADAIERAGVQR